MPARLRDIARAAKKCGLTVNKPNRGSHWKAVGPDGKTYPIPAHNGEKTEVGDNYIRGLCAAFGLDEGEFRSHL